MSRSRNGTAYSLDHALQFLSRNQSKDRLERALATQLRRSGRAAWTGVLMDSAELDNVVSLCIFLHLQPAGPRKARPACASPSPRIACVPSPAAGSYKSLET